MVKTRTYYCSLTKEQKREFFDKMNKPFSLFRKKEEVPVVEPEANEVTEEAENNG